MKKIKQFYKTIFSLDLKIKVRILSAFFCISLLGFSLFAYLKTYSEPIISFQDDPSYLTSRVSGNVVYVNDLMNDWYYYMGKNYTDSDGTLPTTDNKNYYNDQTLAQVKITYSGIDIKNSNYHGYVSRTERQDTYIYFKTYPVNNNNTANNFNDDYIMIELIDNPFTDRPNDKGFNGWISNNQGVYVSYDNNYYIRYAKVPVTYTNNKTNKIELSFYANWIDAAVGTTNSNQNTWSNAFNNLESKQMHLLTTTNITYPSTNMAGYFHKVEIEDGDSCSGYYDEYGNLQNNCTCYGGGYWWNPDPCTYYQIIQNETFNVNNEYFHVVNGRMVELNNSTMAIRTPLQQYAAPYAMAGYFKLVNIPNGSSYDGYYDMYGNALTGNCSGDCDAYELMQYYNADNTINTIDFNADYYYLTTRDTNIIVLTRNISNTWGSSQNKPFTFTGVHNGTTYNTTWTVTNLAVNCYNDTTIENMTIYDRRNLSATYDPTNSTSSSGSFFGRYNNVKLGRGINRSGNYPNFLTVLGGPGSTGSNGNATRYRLMVESGIYNAFGIITGSSSNSNNTIYTFAQAIYGNDYDRANNDNTKLDVYNTAAGSWSGNIHGDDNSDNSIDIAIDLIVKSGEFGTGKGDYTSGIYVGALSYGNHYAARRAKIEGGYIYNLIGGPITYSSRSGINDTYIYMTGGSVDVIIGGAGRSTTYGNRLISVTGGTVNYSVFGGSNSYSGASDEGTLKGSTYVYVGGNAIIGNQTYVNNGSQLWEAEAGSVFGIGNGNPNRDSSTIGSADNSNIIIDQNATIRRNVYGGGNLGATGVSSDSNSAYSKIFIHNGTIQGSVYGGGNKNGAGKTSNNANATIDITMNDGNVGGSIYGGSNQLGTINGNVNIKINGGQITNSVYGGGRGGYSSSSDGTYVTKQVNVVVGDNSVATTPIINGSVYGGSAFGTVNSSERSTTISTYPTNVTVNKGTIGNVFGGGQGGVEGNTTYIPYVAGNITVTINDGDIGSVYGANDAKGIPNGSIKVYLNGGTIGNTFGGGRATGANSPEVYMQGATCPNIFGGSDTEGNVTTSNVICTSGYPNMIYGGNNLGGTTTTTNVTINGCNLNSVYGGGKQASTTTSNVNFNYGMATNVFGGGSEAGVTTTNVNLGKGTITNVFGGSDASGNVTTSNIKNSTAANNANIAINTVVSVSQVNQTNTTNHLSSENLNVTISNNTGANITEWDLYIMTGEAVLDSNWSSATITYNNGVFHINEINQWYATNTINSHGTYNFNFNIHSYVPYADFAITGYLFKGYDAAHNEYIYTSDSTIKIENLYGGNNAGDVTTHAKIDLDSGIITNLYGGGKQAVTGDSDIELAGVTISDTIYGGGDQAAITTVKAVISDSTIGSNEVNGAIYGGGNNAGVNGNIDLTINNGTEVHGTICGGGNNGNVTGNVIARISRTTVTQSIYGGGNNASVNGNITLNVNTNTTVADSIYGGGNNGATLGTTTSTIANTSATNGIYGGGNAANVGSFNNTNTASTLNLNTVTTCDVYGGGRSAGVNGSTDVTITNSTITCNAFGGGNGITSVVPGDSTGELNPAKVTGNASIEITNGTTITENVYGGGNLGFVLGNGHIEIEDSTINSSVYGGGNNGNVNGAVETSIIETLVANNIYGGGNNGSVGSNATTIITTVTGVDNIYGGGNAAGVGGNVILNINTNTAVADSIYGGGNEGDVTGAITTTIANTTVATNIFGGGNNGNVGSNATTTITTVTGVDNIYGGGNNASVNGNITLNVNTNTTVADSIYGGGNNGATLGTTTSTIANTSATNGIYGGGNAANVGSFNNTNTASTLNLNTVTTCDVYGGGRSAGVNGSTDVTITNSTITCNAFGGGNGITSVVPGDSTGELNPAKVTGNASIEITNGTTITENVYGGGNLGFVLGNGHIEIEDSTINSSVYGGGNNGNVNGAVETSIIETLVANNIYGGGNNGSVGSNATTIITTVTGVDNIYGGGNAAGVGGNVILNINTNTAVADSIYGGGNEGDVTGAITTTIANTTVATNIFGGGNNGNVGSNATTTITTVTGVDNIYGGGNNASVNGNITLNVNTNTTVADSIYGGGNNGATLGTTTSTIANTSATNGIYGGGNAANVGSFNNTNTASTLNLNTVTTCDVYGGGRSAGVNGSTDVTITNSTITCNAFGGGNGITSVVPGDSTGELNPAKVTGNASIEITNGTTITENVYGGGNLGFVLGNTNVTINNSDVNINSFGGGNASRVKGNSNVLLTQATIGGSAYAGGNGATAIVEGSTNLDIGNNTDITEHVFGGGNAAATGLPNINTSTGIVNIAGATIGGNVYGGANTSVLYGTANLNIGQNVVTDNTLIPSDIIIGGTVFGGGEANASGSENYDYTFISVTVGININIDGLNHNNFSIGGSIFGSGNASSTTGDSFINISNYGSENNVRDNISVQRATTVTISNSHMKLAGATDRTNEYLNTLFSLSRIQELKLKNNSSLYLKTGANLLEKFSSVVDINDVETKASAQINDQTKVVTRNVNNRLYMYEGKVLNVATNESVTSYGEVYGMTFFGMYREDNSGKPITGLYQSSYDYGDTATSGDVYFFTDGSYVLGLHNTNHNIKVDGFYSNKTVEENPNEIITFYIQPTPPDTSLYMWLIGSKVETYDIELTASKYATLGIHELSFPTYSTPNTSFSILGFNYDGLENGASLVPSANIRRIASSTEVADNTMGLAIKTGQKAWITIGETEFISNPTSPMVGTTLYETENSTEIPSFLFYLYHSKNLGSTGDFGIVTISLAVITPIDDLTNEVKRININVDIKRELYNTNDYEATITVGKQYTMFAPSVVNITSSSSFSAYFSLYRESATNPYRIGDHRVIVSSYVLPIDTKITMIDYTNENMPIYYYYVVTAADYAASLIEYNQTNEVTYRFDKFLKMGSTSVSNNYDDATVNNQYYDANLGLAQEEFIFIVDFKESNINTNVLNNSFLIELRNYNSQTLTAVLGIEQSQMVYNLYHNSDAIIDLQGNLSTINFYNGNNFNLAVSTNFIQQRVASDIIYDTNYYDQKLGIKISIYDEYGNRLTSTSLLGIYFESRGVNYYPRDNGEVRINIAERVANVASRITVHAENSNLAGGNYTIVIESFGSPDGIYYGLTSSDNISLNLRVMDTLYGLSMTISERSIFLDKSTGKNLDDTNTILATVTYQSGLSNPNIRVKMYRRDYSDVYSTTYEEVDFKDYFTNDLRASVNENEYYFNETPLASLVHFLYTKDNLMSGTYKLELRLYDGDTYIGEIYRYLIIK